MLVKERERESTILNIKAMVLKVNRLKFCELSCPSIYICYIIAPKVFPRLMFKKKKRNVFSLQPNPMCTYRWLFHLDAFRERAFITSFDSKLGFLIPSCFQEFFFLDLD